MYILKIRVGGVVGDIEYEKLADATRALGSLAEGMELDILSTTEAKSANGAYEAWIEEMK